MSKGQRGNKEAKKQKKAPTPAKPAAPLGAATPPTREPPRWLKK